MDIDNKNEDIKDVIEDESTDDIDEKNNDYDIKDCPLGDDCIIRHAIAAGLSPSNIRDDPNVREHSSKYHIYLERYFNNPFNRFIERYAEQKYENKMKDIEKKVSLSCFSCNSAYDENRKRYYLSCCANPLCHECTNKLKEESCPFCKRSLEYLNNIDLEEKENTKIDIDQEECFLCYSVLNSTQHTGKVRLKCKCNLELCISCAYKSLQDTTDNEKVTILEDGFRVRENYTIKGKCPQCREIPKNKEEIIMLYGFLPPTY
jgi:hypothetical protein